MPARTVRSKRPGEPDAAPEAIDTHRLDLRTEEAAALVAEDTPDPLTARGLAAVRRQAGASLFPDGAAAPEQSDDWDTWAEGVSDTEHRITELADRLQGRAWLRRLLGGRARPHGR